MNKKQDASKAKSEEFLAFETLAKSLIAVKKEKLTTIEDSIINKRTKTPSKRKLTIAK